MVELEELRYVRLIADNLGSAADYAQRVLGLQPIDKNQYLATFRSDFRDYTLAFVTGDRAGQSVGLEVRYSARLLKDCERLGSPAGGAQPRTARCARSRTWRGSSTSAATALN